jgi:hypothetical protein
MGALHEGHLNLGEYWLACVQPTSSASPSIMSPSPRDLGLDDVDHLSESFFDGLLTISSYEYEKTSSNCDDPVRKPDAGECKRARVEQDHPIRQFVFAHLCHV